MLFKVSASFIEIMDMQGKLWGKQRDHFNYIDLILFNIYNSPFTTSRKSLCSSLVSVQRPFKREKSEELKYPLVKRSFTTYL